jgi:hypothetical protein
MAAMVGLCQGLRSRRHQLWRRLMAVATMVSLPSPPTTMTAILSLIPLALALPWTRIGWRGGGHAVTRLIHCCHGRRRRRHLCLHSRDDGAKEDGRGDRQGCNTNIHSREEVGHHDPIGMEQKKKKKINNSCGNVTTSTPADSYVHAAAAAASAYVEATAAAARG